MVGLFRMYGTGAHTDARASAVKRAVAATANFQLGSEVPERTLASNDGETEVERMGTGRAGGLIEARIDAISGHRIHRLCD